VLADLFAYAPKLKSGGILWGDDFLEDLSRTDDLYGTIDAVNTFLKRTDFKCLAILGCSECQYVLSVALDQPLREPAQQGVIHFNDVPG
jgi:hypothetical protein